MGSPVNQLLARINLYQAGKLKNLAGAELLSRLYVNESFTKMTGYSGKEVIGAPPQILQGPKSDKKALLHLRQSMEKWENCEIEIINYKKNKEGKQVYSG